MLRNLTGLLVFRTVITEGSLSAAARTLGMSRSAVSQRLQSLEEELGLRLAHRTTRSLQPTAAGKALLPLCADIAHAASAIEDRVAEHRGQPVGDVVLSAPKGPALHYAAPAIARLRRTHPGLKVELRVQEQRIDLTGESVDVALRAGPLADSSLTARRLAPLRLLICASPDYLDDRGRPQHREQLQGLDWLVFTPLGARLPLAEGPMDVQPVAKTDDGDVLLSWVRAGLGLALLPDFYVRHAIQRDEVEVVLPDLALDAGGIWAVHAFARRVPPRVRALLDALTEGTDRKSA